MKIELQMNDRLKKPTIIIQAPKLTEDIEQILQLFKQQDSNLIVYDQEKIMIVPLQKLHLVRTEEKIVTATKHYTTNKGLI